MGPTPSYWLSLAVALIVAWTPVARADEPSDCARNPKVVVHEELAHVLLDGANAGLTFHLHAASTTGEPAAARPLFTARAYTRLCTAPCAIEVSTGSHGFGLSERDGDVAEADEEVIVRDGDTIRGTYHARSTTRVLGWTLIPSSIVGGMLIAWAGVNANDHDRCTGPTSCERVTDPNVGIIVGGVGVALIGSVLGWKLAHLGDWASFEIVPSRRSVHRF